jgi:isochorismate pyruvate lyase
MSEAGGRGFVAKDPDACADLAEVRAGIDEVDARLIELLARRQAYAAAAAMAKTERSAVRDEARIAQVMANASERGREHGVLPEIVEPIWRAMIEAYVAYEHRVFDAANRARRLAEQPSRPRGND